MIFQIFNEEKSGQENSKKSGDIGGDKTGVSQNGGGETEQGQGGQPGKTAVMPWGPFINQNRGQDEKGKYREFYGFGNQVGIIAWLENQKPSEIPLAVDVLKPEFCLKGALAQIQK